MINEAAEAQAEARSPSRRKNLMVGGILLAVMIVEALVVVVLVKSFSSAAPQPTLAGTPGLNPGEGERAPLNAEVKVAEFRAQNQKGQRIQVFDFVVYATVPEPNRSKFEDAIQVHSARIKDRFIGVVRAMDPERFTEPDLMTLRTRLKGELVQVVGPEVNVGEVLFTSFSAYAEN